MISPLHFAFNVYSVLISLMFVLATRHDKFNPLNGQHLRVLAMEVFFVIFSIFIYLFFKLHTPFKDTIHIWAWAPMLKLSVWAPNVNFIIRKVSV